MSITAAQVKELRDKTGLGMMACKKALTEAEGDTEKAIENLRKQGQATAAKRADRAAKEGKVSVVVQNGLALLYEVNSETDFVARNEDFLGFVDTLGNLLIEKKPADMDAALSLKSDVFGGLAVSEKVTELIGKIGENIAFRRFEIVEFDTSKERVFTYVHGDGRIGVAVTISSDNAEALGNTAVEELGKDIAMQVAASSPIAVNRDGVSADLLAKEKEIYLTQAQTSGRPEKVWDKIVDGKIAKFFKEIVLIEQEFIKDSDLSVTDRVKKTEEAVGAPVAVASFRRFELGA